MVTKKRKKRTAKKKLGLGPGSLVYTGDQTGVETNVSVVDFDGEYLSEIPIKNVEDCIKYKDSHTTTWINVTGLHDVSVIKNLGEAFNIHPLALEDVLNLAHRPKFEEYDNHIFIVLKFIDYNSSLGEFATEQISFVLSEKYLITFQENGSDTLSVVKDRLKSNPKGRLRTLKSDYLCYALIDLIVDNYFVALEKFEDQVDLVDEAVVKDPTHATLTSIFSLKREIAIVRKAVFPVREIVSGLSKTEADAVREETLVYLRDLNDHCVTAMELIDSIRDSLTSMVELYMSGVSVRVNETMKVLTVMASIFIPLTFVVGVYGMNFEYMPELHWRYGYALCWTLMLAITLCLLGFFKKLKWL